MKTRILSGLAAVLLPALCLHAQLPASTGALKVGDLPPGSIGLRVGDFSRSLSDGPATANLSMLRVTVSMQLELQPGVYPWVEAGWHDPELLRDKSSGGFTWGTGLHLRPLMKSLRNDPQLGPRDWIALTLDLAARGGEADADAGKIDWLNVEGVVGMAWHKKYIGRDDGPIGAHDVTAGAGVVFSSFEGNQGGFNGSEEQAVGLRVNTAFSFGETSFLQLELDLYGSSDRRVSLASGFKF